MRIAFAIVGGLCAGAACTAFGSNSPDNNVAAAPDAGSDAQTTTLSDGRVVDNPPANTAPPYDASTLGLPAECLTSPILVDDFERDVVDQSPWGIDNTPRQFLSIDHRFAATGASSLLIDFSNAGTHGSTNDVVATPVTPSVTGSLCVVMALAIRVGDLSPLGDGYNSLLDLRAGVKGGSQTASFSINIDSKGLFLKTDTRYAISSPTDGVFRRWAFLVSPPTSTVSVYAGDQPAVTAPIPVTMEFVPDGYNVALGADAFDLSYSGTFQIHVDDVSVH
jgi:hypothetical protein